MSEFLMRKIASERGPIDFLLCAGDGISDEEMFAQVRKKLEQEPELFAREVMSS
jgi:trehalose-6-phosphatase